MCHENDLYEVDAPAVPLKAKLDLSTTVGVPLVVTQTVTNSLVFDERIGHCLVMVTVSSLSRHHSNIQWLP